MPIWDQFNSILFDLGFRFFFEKEGVIVIGLPVFFSANISQYV